MSAREGVSALAGVPTEFSVCPGDRARECRNTYPSLTE